MRDRRRACSSIVLLACAAATGGCAGGSAPATEPARSSASPSPPPPAATANGATATAWNPRATRALVVCLSTFAGQTEATWSQAERLDTKLVEVLKARGVPADKLLFLIDKDATSDHLAERVPAFLGASSPDETLIVYVGSHGSYNHETGAHGFSTFDGHLPIDFVFDAVENHFHGARALVFSDTCYSGGFVDMAQRRAGKIAYAALSSTFSQQVGWSGWRFVDVLTRAFEGNPVVDLDGDGRIVWRELAGYARSYMAFVAEGMPESMTSGALGPAFELARAVAPKKDAQVGGLVEVEWHGKWYLAEVIDVKGPELKVHYTANVSSKDDAWVPPERVRSPAYTAFPVGARLEVSSGSRWYPATVLEVRGAMRLCRYEGWNARYDEWFGPSRMRVAQAPASAEGAAPTLAPADDLPH